MYCWRITKYDPNKRDKDGLFLEESWTSFSDVGRITSGSRLTVNEYIQVEEAYIKAVEYFFEPVKDYSVEICDFEQVDSIEEIKVIKERYFELYPQELLCLFLKLKDGYSLCYEEIGNLCRLILREHIWGKISFEDDDRKIFAHFGYDYYMYLGSSFNDKKVMSNIKKTGLYIEPYDSPYI